MSTVQLLAKSSVIRIVETIVSVLTGFFMMPFLITHLGESDYGVWILIGSITATLYIFDLGFTEAITRFIGDSLNKKEYRRTNQVISTALVIYSLLSILVVAATLVTVFFASVVVEQPENVTPIRYLVAITGLTIALEFPFKAFAGIAVSRMRYDLISMSRISVKIINVAVTVYMVADGCGLITISVIAFVTNQIGNWVYYILAVHLFREMKVRGSYIDKKMFREILNFSKWTFLIDFSGIVKSRMDLFIIAAYLSTSILTAYYVALRLVEYSTRILVMATNFTTPLFVKYNSENCVSEIIIKMKIFTRVNLLLGVTTFGFFFLFGRDLILLWMGVDFPVDTTYSVLLIIFFGKVLRLVCSPASSVLIALSLPKIVSIVDVVEIFLSAALIYFFIGFAGMGVVGAALGLTVPLIFTKLILIPYLTSKSLNISILEFHRSILIPAVFSLMAILLWWVAFSRVELADLFLFSMASLVYGLSMGVVVLLALNSEELMIISKIVPRRVFNLFVSVVAVKKRFLF